MSLRYLSIFVPLMTALALLAPAGAADGVNLSGVVVDQDRHPLKGVGVSLAIAGSATKTDAQGAWTLTRPAGVDDHRPKAKSGAATLEVQAGRIAVLYKGADLAGRTERVKKNASALGARQTVAAVDTLLLKMGSRTFRFPLASTTLGAMDTCLIHTDTATSTALELRATRYDWNGSRGLGLGLANTGTETFDSLRIRLFLNGKRAELLDFAARIDVAFHYKADGFMDTGLFAATKRVQYARPRSIDRECAADSVCAWSFDLPFADASLSPGGRWRLDVVFDRHNLIRDTTEMLNMPPTHDPYAGADWSFRAHVAGSDGGVSERNYAGVPVMSKNAIDSAGVDIPLNPYIAVYRGERLLYGNPP